MLEKEHGVLEAETQASQNTRDTLYLCNFRVSVDGEWLCLKELADLPPPAEDGAAESVPGPRPDLEQLIHYPDYPFGRRERDPVIIERSNLVNILKLVIKEVIDSSLKFGRQLDSDHIPLQHFFIVLEHALKHGLRPKKGLLGPKKELWDLLQLVEKRHSEAVDITASVRDLPTVKTNLGRARAWLRLALMQKKMADYFRILVEQRDDILSEYYEPRALLRSEEATLIVGLLVSLNVVDCNLCVKEEDLDSQQGVIDFSLYLRHKKDMARENEGQFVDESSNQMTAVLDQKNYIEELNRHLTATVTNLETKVESLTTTNALMREDLAIHKALLAKALEDNKRLSLQVSPISNSNQNDSSLPVQLENSPVPAKENHSDLKNQLQNVTQKKENAEQELKLQISMKAEMEMAMKLLERDVHEKQDTIIGLRDQLEEIKDINLDMYTKLQECEKSLGMKSILISKLEGKCSSVSDILEKADTKLSRLEAENARMRMDRTNFESQSAQQRQEMLQLKADLEIEREWRKRLEISNRRDRATLQDLTRENEILKQVEKGYNSVKTENDNLSARVKESEKALAELGDHLSRSKLEADKLRERIVPLGQWQSDKDVEQCQNCDKTFNLSRRKHHCRSCGRIFCVACSDNKLALPSSSQPVRVCDICYWEIMQHGTI
ncbi:RUN and FYVE domain-containing protein 2-like isoform X2 [Tigriopus californicus]|uniref:RUN and FYVE domain-containing protein 2-like isoform X2 n=1 Tax=Tigriopus californicus TaxID=6832 RepID=UPI0027DA1232|nr:RUN and FYVE domain-containing protein 2-like isoform X2 [Tigriopus californicus]